MPVVGPIDIHPHYHASISGISRILDVQAARYEVKDAAGTVVHVGALEGGGVDVPLTVVGTPGHHVYEFGPFTHTHHLYILVEHKAVGFIPSDTHAPITVTGHAGAQHWTITTVLAGNVPAANFNDVAVTVAQHKA